MKKIKYGLFFVLAGLILGTACSAAEQQPIPIRFTKAGGGQYIYCNNPEYVGEEDLSTDENQKATYLMKCENLKPDNYSVFFCFYNWTDFDVEPDMEFYSDTGAQIRIDSVAYCLPTGDEFWDCIGAWADFLNINICTLNGYQQYVPFRGREFPQTISLEPGNRDWTSQYLYNYKTVPSRMTFLMLVKFTVLSGEADVNFAALKHYGNLRDRTHHNPDALPGTYRRDTSIKGIETESLPMVEANLNVEITPETKNGTSLPVRIFNQYYNDGNTAPYWMTNINPNRDEYLFSKTIAAGSDMLSFRFQDDSKLEYYGEEVPAQKRDNVWIFDIYHHDTTGYEEGMPWSKEEHVPNAYTGTKMDIDNLPNLDWEFNLGNFGVTNRYHLNIYNSDNQPRILNYFLETSLSSNILIVRDKDGVMLNPYTLKPENPFALCKGINRQKVNSCLFSVEVAPGERAEYILDLILPTNCYGGMVNSLTVDSRKKLMPVAGSDFPQFSEEFPFPDVFYNGREYMRWRNEELYHLQEGTWRKVKLPSSAMEVFQSRSRNYDIVKTDWGYAARFCGWDGGVDWCIGNTASQNKIYLFDKNFRFRSVWEAPTYVYDLLSSNGKIYCLSDDIYETSDGKSFSKTEGQASFPECNGLFTLVREGNVLSLREPDKGDIPIRYESMNPPREAKATGGLFYCRKSWKTYFSDLDTPNILSVSTDGLYWTDFQLPNTFLELKKVLYLNGKIWIDARYQTFVLDYQPPETVRMILKGEALGFEVPPETQNDRTMIPARFLFEKLHAAVDWNQETEEITLTGAGHTILFQIGRETAVVDGEERPLDAPPYLSGDRTMIPLRFLAENLGYQVDWDEARRLVTVK